MAKRVGSPRALKIFARSSTRSLLRVLRYFDDYRSIASARRDVNTTVRACVECARDGRTHETNRGSPRERHRRRARHALHGRLLPRRPGSSAEHASRRTRSDWSSWAAGQAALPEDASGTTTWPRSRRFAARRLMGLAVHYVTGVALTQAYYEALRRGGRKPGVLSATAFGAATALLPLLVMYPSWGLGPFALRSGEASRLLRIMLARAHGVRRRDRSLVRRAHQPGRGPRQLVNGSRRSVSGSRRESVDPGGRTLAGVRLAHAGPPARLRLRRRPRHDRGVRHVVRRHQDGAAGFEPLLIALLRFTLAGALLWLVWRLRPGREPPPAGSCAGSRSSASSPSRSTSASRTSASRAPAPRRPRSSSPPSRCSC